MGLRKRLAAAFFAASITLSAFAGAASAKSYPDGCDETDDSANPAALAQLTTTRYFGGAPYELYDGVSVTFDYTLAFEACGTSIFSTWGGWTGVFPANICNWQSGCDEFVQLGLVDFSGNNGPSGSGSENGEDTFVFTANDSAGGAFVSAESWAGEPSVGKTYRFRIDSVFANGRYNWQYFITDLTANPDIVYSSPLYPSSWNKGTHAYTYYESQNQNNRVGGLSSATTMKQYIFKVRRAGGAFNEYSPGPYTYHQAGTGPNNFLCNTDTNSFRCWTITD